MGKRKVGKRGETWDTKTKAELLHPVLEAKHDEMAKAIKQAYYDIDQLYERVAEILDQEGIHTQQRLLYRSYAERLYQVSSRFSGKTANDLANAITTLFNLYGCEEEVLKKIALLYNLRVEVIVGVAKLSQLIIDCNKDWKGYVIKNLGTPVDGHDSARKAEVDAVQENLNEHSIKDTGVHGAGTNYICYAEAQGYIADKALEGHSIKDTDVHGAGTNYISYAKKQGYVADEALEGHNIKDTGVHGAGVNYICYAEAQGYVADKALNEHNLKDTGVHGAGTNYISYAKTQGYIADEALNTHKKTIDDHDDVAIVSPRDGDVLMFDGATGEWKNSPLYVSRIQTYPKLEHPISVQTGSGAWVEGEWTEIIPAGTITEDFLIVGVWWFVSIYHAILEIGKGAAGAEEEIIAIPSWTAYRTDAGYILYQPIFFSTPVPVEANARIAARVADANTDVTTHSVKVIYALK
ncbi:MAG: hypothetical protein DRP27_05330 [Thermotogae bacterium]|nr:MAG: hypothetical protein DRP27_05330 [Thermotogota bacterium]